MYYNWIMEQRGLFPNGYLMPELRNGNVKYGLKCRIFVYLLLRIRYFLTFYCGINGMAVSVSKSAILHPRFKTVAE